MMKVSLFCICFSIPIEIKVSISLKNLYRTDFLQSFKAISENLNIFVWHVLEVTARIKNARDSVTICNRQGC